MERLVLLLIVSVLLGRANCGPPTIAAAQVTATTSSDPQSEPESTSTPPHPEPTTAAETSDAGAATQRDATLDQVIAALDGLCQSAGRAAIAGPFAALTNALAGIQTSMAAMSSRLDVMQASQLELEKRLDASQAEASSRLDAAQTQLEDIITAISRIPKTALGEACTRDTDCSRRLPEATCSASGVCTCRDGYRKVSELQCRQHSRLNEVCLEDADCQTPNSTCRSNTCSCGSGLWNYNNTECRRIAAVNMGGRCVGDQDCQTQTANSRCRNNTCSCVSGLWNYNNAECRRVAAVNMGGRCVGDQDCHSRLSQRCISNTCSCETRTYGRYEYRLVGGPSCREGNVELRLTGGSWGLVCDDGWAKAAPAAANVLCRSLGFTSGQPTRQSQYGRGTNFLMDEVECYGSEEHLMLCPYDGWGRHDCGAGEVAGARCHD